MGSCPIGWHLSAARLGTALAPLRRLDLFTGVYSAGNLARANYIHLAPCAAVNPVNPVNPNPCLLSTAELALSAKEAGKAYAEVIEGITSALSRYGAGA